MGAAGLGSVGGGGYRWIEGREMGDARSRAAPAGHLLFLAPEINRVLHVPLSRSVCFCRVRGGIVSARWLAGWLAGCGRVAPAAAFRPCALCMSILEVGGRSSPRCGVGGTLVRVTPELSWLRGKVRLRSCLAGLYVKGYHNLTSSPS